VRVLVHCSCRATGPHLDVAVGNPEAVAVVHRYEQLLEQPPRVRLQDAHLHDSFRSSQRFGRPSI
jgi:hypothetical protein